MQHAEIEVERRRVVKDKHLKPKLHQGNSRIDAIQFNFSSQPGNRIRTLRRFAINQYMGVESPQLIDEYFDQ